jgi:hypothetical protein
MYGVATDDWQLLEVVVLPEALPAAPVPQHRLRKPVDLGDGIFVAGDHRDSPSIQGALASGWRTAGAVLASLGTVNSAGGTVTSAGGSENSAGGVRTQPEAL